MHLTSAMGHEIVGLLFLKINIWWKRHQGGKAQACLIISNLERPAKSLSMPTTARK
jgi:hypothetical protein